MAASPNGTVLVGIGALITDNAGNTYQITPSRQIAVNGVIDPPTSRVDILAYQDGVLWQKNADNNWYGITSPTATWTNWTGANPPVTIPNVSPNETVASGTNYQITDSNGNQWSIDNGPQHQIIVDGLPVPGTANVVEIAEINGALWQQNASGGWWSATSPDGSWTPMDSPQASWIGGGDNSAALPNNWSSLTSPQPGHLLFLSQGTINVAGDSLNGNVLHVSDSATLGLSQGANVVVDLVAHDSGNFGPLTVNVSGHEGLTIRASTPSLGVQGMTVNMTAGSTLDLTTAPGGGLTNNTALTVNGVGSNININGVVAAPGMILNTDVTGTGTLNAGYRHPADLHINGSVAAGVSVIGGQDFAVIDHATTFAGVFSGNSVSLGDLTATSYNFNNNTGVFTFYNNDTVVDTFRTNNPSYLNYHVTSNPGSGVINLGVFPVGPDLPLHS